MPTVIEPSQVAPRLHAADRPQVASVKASAILAANLAVGDLVTNVGVVVAVNRIGVFVVASIRGTMWSLASGSGDVHDLDVIWHESVTVSVDDPDAGEVY